MCDDDARESPAGSEVDDMGARRQVCETMHEGAGMADRVAEIVLAGHPQPLGDGECIEQHSIGR